MRKTADKRLLDMLPATGKGAPATTKALPWHCSIHSETFPPVKRQGLRKRRRQALAFYWKALPSHEKKSRLAENSRACLVHDKGAFTAGRLPADGAEGYAGRLAGGHLAHGEGDALPPPRIAVWQEDDLVSSRGRASVKEVTPMLKRFLLDVLAGFLASVLAAVVAHLMGI